MKIRWEVMLYGDRQIIVGDVIPPEDWHPVSMTRFLWMNPSNGAVMESSVPSAKVRQLFEPRNSDEGLAFEDDWCSRCTRLKKGCKILESVAAKGFSVEWIWKNSPVCLKFKPLDDGLREHRRMQRLEKKGQLSLMELLS